MAQQTLVKDDVLERVALFAEKLEHVDEVQHFRRAERMVNESPRVQRLIEKIKRTQKELVHADHFAKPSYKRYKEEELARLQAELDNLPIVREYQQRQVEMNGLLQLIQDAIGSEVAKVLDIETGGEVVSGCSNGGPCGCK